jgi:hypothetical protein
LVGKSGISINIACVIRNEINIAIPPKLHICLLDSPFSTGLVRPYRFLLAARCKILGVVKITIRKLQIKTRIKEYMSLLFVVSKLL